VLPDGIHAGLNPEPCTLNPEPCGPQPSTLLPWQDSKVVPVGRPHAGNAGSCLQFKFTNEGGTVRVSCDVCSVKCVVCSGHLPAVQVHQHGRHGEGER
jgi:hypothetical protein